MMVENILPHYNHFAQYERWENTEIIKEALSLLSACILKEVANENEKLMSILEKVESETPDLDEISGNTASYGFDACIVIWEALSFFKDKKDASVYNIVNGVIESVDMCIQENDAISAENEKIEELIENNLFMQNEFNRQEAITQYLLGVTEKITQSHVEQVRMINSKYGPVINFDLLTQ